VNCPISKKDQVSEEQWALRIELAAPQRIVDQLGVTDVIYDHMTAKAPGSGDAFLINAHGLQYSEIRASNLLKIDMSGEVLLGSRPEWAAARRVLDRACTDYMH